MLDGIERSGHIKAVLRHYYDASFIQTSPLAERLQVRTDERDIVAAIRSLLRDAIAQLQPDASVPFGRPEWMAHQILTQRYIHLKSKDAICNDLALGRSSYYRYHQQALEALCAWVDAQIEQLPQVVSDSASPSSAPTSSTAAEEMERLAKESPQQLVDLDDLLDDVASLLEPLLAQKQCHLVVQHAQPDLCVVASPTLLRQAFVGLISAGLKLGIGGHSLVTVQLSAGNAHIRVQPLVEYGTIDDLAALPGTCMARALLNAYGGSLDLRRAPDGAISADCQLPTAHDKHILIMDDNQDGARLLSTYLVDCHYGVDCVHTEAQLDAAMQSVRPDLILLDILMPETDGWSILQRLKSHPETRSIPVLVCSVLSQSQLALALGAHAVLQKPIDEQALVAAIESALATGASIDPQGTLAGGNRAAR